MSEKKHTTTTITSAAPSTRKRTRTTQRAASAPPWIEGGIDYGPALVAADELIAWAFDLAAASVADSPADTRRVKNARRSVTASLRGKRRPADAEADVWFTGALLIQIFNADLGLGMNDIVSALSEMGLPTIDVPHPPRRPTARTAPAAQPAPVVPTAAELAALIAAIQRTADEPVPAPVVPLRRPPSRAAAPSACTSCWLARSGFRVAA